MSKSPLLTIGQVAEHLNVSDRHVRQLIADSLIPACRFGRSVRVHADDLTAYIESART